VKHFIVITLFIGIKLEYWNIIYTIDTINNILRVEKEEKEVKE
jgi:hypothetical protein